MSRYCHENCYCGGTRIITREVPMGTSTPITPRAVAYGQFYSTSSATIAVGSPTTLQNVPLAMPGPAFLYETLNNGGVQVGLNGVYQIDWYAENVDFINDMGIRINTNPSYVQGSVDTIAGAQDLAAGQTIISLNAGDVVYVAATPGNLTGEAGVVPAVSITVTKIA